MVRVAVRADLLQLENDASHFQLDKTWLANVHLENSLSAFKPCVPSLAETTCEPK